MEKNQIKKVVDTTRVHIAEKYSVKNYKAPATSIALHEQSQQNIREELYDTDELLEECQLKLY